MGLFPRWSKEKLTDEEVYLKENRAKDREMEKNERIKGHQRNLDEQVIDQSDFMNKEIFEEVNYEVDMIEINEHVNGIPNKHRVLKYPHDRH